MADDEAAPPALILSASEAKRRYLIYFAMRLCGLAVLFGGVFLARETVTPLSLVLIGIGGATLFVRPRMLGLTTRAPTRPDV